MAGISNFTLFCIPNVGSQVFNYVALEQNSGNALQANILTAT